MQKEISSYSVGKSLDFSRREIGWFVVGVCIMSAFVLLVFPSPVNTILIRIVCEVTFVMLMVGILIGKVFLGIRVKTYTDSVWIYRSNSFLIHPKNDELVYAYSRGGYSAAVSLSYENISSVRKISKTEIKQLRDVHNVPITSTFPIYVGLPLPIVGASVPVNKGTQTYMKFLSDYSSVVEIVAKELTVPHGASIEDFKKLLKHPFKNDERKDKEKNVKILVSVGDTDRFIREITAKISK